MSSAPRWGRGESLAVIPLTLLFRLPFAIVLTPIGAVLFLGAGLFLWVMLLTLAYPFLLLASIVGGDSERAKAIFVVLITLFSCRAEASHCSAATRPCHHWAPEQVRVPKAWLVRVTNALWCCIMSEPAVTSQ